MIKTNETCASLDTSRVHYVKPPENHIVIDFDIPDEDGNKCYAAGIHLQYIYTGDASKLARVCS